MTQDSIATLTDYMVKRFHNIFNNMVRSIKRLTSITNNFLQHGPVHKASYQY